MADEGRGADEDISVVDVLPLIDRLVAKGLVLFDENGRYRLINIVQEYAKDRLEEEGEGGAVHERHLKVYAELTRDSEEKIHGANQSTWIAVFDAENDNLRAALDYGYSVGSNSDIAVETTLNLFPFWFIRANYREAVSYFDSALGACPPTPSDVRANLLRRQGVMCLYSGDKRAGELLSRSLEMARKAGEPQTLADALFCYGDYLHLENQNELASEHFVQALVMFEQLGDTSGVALDLHVLGNIALVSQEYEKAEAYLQRALDMRRTLSDRRGIGAALASLSSVYTATGDLTKAAQTLLEAVVILADANDLFNIGGCLIGTASHLVAAGQNAEAARLVGFADALVKEIGGRRDAADTAEYESVKAANLAALGEDAVTELSVIGGQLTLSEALKLSTDYLARF